MTHAQNTLDIPAPTPEEASLSRKAFLAETLGIAAAVSAWLAQSGAPAAGNEGETIPLARHLEAQFNEEAQVAAQYAAFAVQARAEGLPQTARLFDALVAAENLHAEWLLRLKGGVRSTADNLKAGADYESYLAGKVLPVAAAQAGREGDSKARTLLQKLDAACLRHETVMRQVREQILSGRDVAAQPLWICPKCGTVLVGVAPDTCPVCAATKAEFVRVP
jgi:rubrerythrin